MPEQLDTLLSESVNNIASASEETNRLAGSVHDFTVAQSAARQENPGGQSYFGAAADHTAVERASQFTPDAQAVSVAVDPSPLSDSGGAGGAGLPSLARQSVTQPLSSSAQLSVQARDAASMVQVSRGVDPVAATPSAQDVSSEASSTGADAESSRSRDELTDIVVDPFDGSNPLLEIVETSSIADGRLDASGDEITYTITVTNTGDATLFNIEVTDVRAVSGDNPTGLVGVIAELAPGQSSDPLTFTYVLTESDLSSPSGTLDSLAQATGYTLSGDLITASTGSALAIEPPLLPLGLADLQVFQSADVVDGALDAIGDVITFRVSLTNTGEVELFGIEITDPRIPGVIAVVPSLLPGESSQAFEYQYTISSDDLAHGFATFSASASAAGVTAQGDSVTASAFSSVPVISVDTAAALETLVSAVVADQQLNQVGDELTVSYSVQNTGPVTLFEIEVVDLRIASPQNPRGVVGVLDRLEAGATSPVFTVTTPVTTVDLGASATELIITATSSAATPLGRVVSDASMASLPIIREPILPAVLQPEVPAVVAPPLQGELPVVTDPLAPAVPENPVVIAPEAPAEPVAPVVVQPEVPVAVEPPAEPVVAQPEPPAAVVPVVPVAPAYPEYPVVIAPEVPAEPVAPVVVQPEVPVAVEPPAEPVVAQPEPPAAVAPVVPVAPAFPESPVVIAPEAPAEPVAPVVPQPEAPVAVEPPAEPVVAQPELPAAVVPVVPVAPAYPEFPVVIAPEAPAEPVAPVVVQPEAPVAVEPPAEPVVAQPQPPAVVVPEPPVLIPQLSISQDLLDVDGNNRGHGGSSDSTHQPLGVGDQLTVQLTVSNPGQVQLTGVSLSHQPSGWTGWLDHLPVGAEQTFVVTYTLTAADLLAERLDDGLWDAVATASSDQIAAPSAVLSLPLDLPAELQVGSLGDDSAMSSLAFASDDRRAGVLEGSAVPDILIGDPGASSPLAGSTANVVLVLDLSSSMSGTLTNGSGSISRLDALQQSISTVVDQLVHSDAQNVRVHLDQFSTSASPIGTFTLIENGVIQSDAIDDVLDAIDDLRATGFTNYEAGLQSALNWLQSTGSDSPFRDADHNTLLFVSDGEPNRALTGNGTVLSTGSTVSMTAQQAMDHVFGRYNPAGTINDDTVNEVALLQALNLGAPLTMETIGISVTAQTLARLSSLEGPEGSADAVTNSAQLTASLLDASQAHQHQHRAGSDRIDAGFGDDLLFGDVPNTDPLAAARQLSLPTGSGWMVFQQLESVSLNHQGSGSGSWSRADTVAYIQANGAVLAAEAGRIGGHDVLLAGPGRDVVYGQEGDDRLVPGSGADWLHGGSGADRFLFSRLDGDAIDTIADFSRNDDRLVFMNADAAELIAIDQGRLTYRVAWTGHAPGTVTIDFLSGETPSIAELAFEMAPVILDLDRNGFQVDQPLRLEDPVFGALTPASLFAQGDGLLVYDVNLDERVSQADEVVFTHWAPDASGDIEAIRLAFDSNGDASLDALDHSWTRFRVWADFNQDGVLGADETQSMAEVGLAALDLTHRHDAPPHLLANGEISVLGETDLHWLDGSISRAADVAISMVQDTNPSSFSLLLDQALADPARLSDSADVVAETVADHAGGAPMLLPTLHLSHLVDAFLVSEPVSAEVAADFAHGVNQHQAIDVADAWQQMEGPDLGSDPAEFGHDVAETVLFEAQNLDDLHHLDLILHEGYADAPVVHEFVA